MADEPIWTALYPDGLSAAPPHVPTSLVTAWRDRVAASPESPCLIYFDSTLTVRRVDDDSDALAAHLQDRGVGRGDVVGVQLQNIPQFAIAMLALWKVGATVLILNPMYRGGELRRLIDDSRAIGFIGLDREGEEAASTLAGSTVAWRMTTSDLDLQSEDDPRLFEDAARVVVDGADDLLTAVQENAGRTPSAAEVRAEDAALLTYTSGTTGPPKGALNTHRNVLSTAVSFNAWQGIGAGDVVLAVAPLFHITGAVATARGDAHLRRPARLHQPPAPRGHAGVVQPAPRERDRRRDHGLQRPPRPGPRRRGGPRLRPVAVLRRSADPSVDRGAVPGEVRPLHPQHLRHDGDRVRRHRRAAGGACAGR